MIFTSLEVLHLLLNIFIALASIIAALTAMWNRRAIHRVHLIINSRLDELVRATSVAARLQGAEDQRASTKAEGQARIDAMAHSDI